jgi:hypothetical protein
MDWSKLTVPALHVECQRRGLALECRSARLKRDILALLRAHEKAAPASPPSPAELEAKGLLHKEADHAAHIELTRGVGAAEAVGAPASYTRVLEMLDQHLKSGSMTRSETEHVIGTAAGWLNGLADSLELEEARETAVPYPKPTRRERLGQAAKVARTTARTCAAIRIGAASRSRRCGAPGWTRASGRRTS